jgi:hypothetical protein
MTDFLVKRDDLRECCVAESGDAMSTGIFGRGARTSAYHRYLATATDSFYRAGPAPTC